MDKGTVDKLLRRFLATRQDPRHLASAAARDELIAQIVDTLHGHQPDDAGEPWFGEVCERVTMQTKGWGWPSPETWARAVGAATAGHEKKKAASNFDHMEPGTLTYADRVFAERLHKGEATGEHDLFGSRADRCLQDGRITLTLLRRSQKAAFAKWKNTYGEQAARDRLAALCPALFADMFPVLAGAQDKRLPPEEDAETFGG